MGAMSTIPMPSSNARGGVLIASASPVLREHVLHSLEERCCPVRQVLGGADALFQLENGDWQVLFLDRRLPDLDAEELIQIIKSRFPGIEVVLVDSDGVPNGGKPVRHPERPSFSSAVAQRNSQNSLPEVEPLPEVFGNTEPMLRVSRLVRLVAPRNVTVLIMGETGTGKELLAHAVHRLSPRAQRAFVIVNCAAIPETLLESELFGYVRGAFTGAVQSHQGRIHAAQGGTLFLDEVGEMPLGLQAKLLRFLEQKEIQRLGSVETTRVDVRVVAATNLDLMEKVRTRGFREDLYYRLSAFPVEIPALAARIPDISVLANHFLQKMSAEVRAACPSLSGEALRMLEAHPWRGNVRELQHVMERAAILADGKDVILPEHLYFHVMEAKARAERTQFSSSLDLDLPLTVGRVPGLAKESGGWRA